MVYLDNAATTFPKPEIVYDSIMDAMKNYGANPGRSGHKLAMKASRGIYEARQALADLFDIHNPMNIILLFNATEALNTAIKGFLKAGDHAITTSMEHNSVLRPLKYLENFGVETTIVEANKEGMVDPKDIERVIKSNTKLIATTHISNLTGSILPIEEIGKIAQDNDIRYLLDASQSAGVYDLYPEKMGIDLMAFPGHKGLLGPQGTGGLYIKEGIVLETQMHGGTGSASHSLIQPDINPDKFESGTGNTPGIVGLGAGVKYILDRGMKDIREYEEKLTRHFMEEAGKIEGIKLYGPKDLEHHAAVVALNIKDGDSSEVAYILNEEYDIYVRPGLHCAPLAHETIGTIDQGAVRFSFGIFNSHEDIEYAIKALRDIAKEI